MMSSMKGGARWQSRFRIRLARAAGFIKLIIRASSTARCSSSASVLRRCVSHRGNIHGALRDATGTPDPWPAAAERADEWRQLVGARQGEAFLHGGVRTELRLWRL